MPAQICILVDWSGSHLWKSSAVCTDRSPMVSTINGNKNYKTFTYDEINEKENNLVFVAVWIVCTLKYARIAVQAQFDADCRTKNSQENRRTARLVSMNSGMLHRMPLSEMHIQKLSASPALVRVRCNMRRHTYTLTHCEIWRNSFYTHTHTTTLIFSVWNCTVSLARR